ncbi:MAG: carboxypeptidase regulatory-like domain-containing protein [Caldilineaceae bacterium]
MRVVFVVLFVTLLIVSGCAPSVRNNVIAYLITEQFGTTNLPASTAPPGSLEGFVELEGKPLAGVTVVVAERTGKPYTARTDEQGHYQIVGIPPGQYVPGAVAPGIDEIEPLGSLGLPWLVTIRSQEVTQAPLLRMQRHVPTPLPAPLANSVQLSVTAQFTSATNFPAGSQADVTAFQFVYQGVAVDTLRLYLPRSQPAQLEADTQYPLLFMVYPSPVDLWVSVSTAYAAQGYTLVAISPMAAHALDVDAHAQDARVALALAESGALSPHVRPGKAIALGGSFSSAILNRLLRDSNDGNGQDAIGAWVTVGGIANAFTGAADFYAGRIQVPPDYRLLIPALGPANLYPLPFLRYSPVYVAGQLPPTLIIHTDADAIIPIEQAKELESQLRAAGVPTEVFYYQDVSHYLQIGDDMTEAGQEMFWRILEFIKRYQ